MTHKVHPEPDFALFVPKRPAPRTDFAAPDEIQFGDLIEIALASDPDTGAVLTGPPPPGSPPIFLRAMYIRVGMLTGAQHPRFRLQTHEGPSIYLRSDEQALFSYPRHLDYAGDARVDEEPGHSYLITVRLTASASLAWWKLGITNADQQAEACYAMVVADSVEETAQPWNDTTPIPKHVQLKPIPLDNLGIAVDQANGRVYAVQPVAPPGRITSVDPLGHLDEGTLPQHALVDPDTHEIYYAVKGGAVGTEVDVVPRIPLSPGDRVRTVAVYQRNPPDGVLDKPPTEIALDHVNRTLYAALPGRIAVSTIDSAQPPVETVTSGNLLPPNNLALDIDSQTLYTLSPVSNVVLGHEIRDRAIRRSFSVSPNMRSLALSGGGRALYVGVERLGDDGPGICVVDRWGLGTRFKIRFNAGSPIALAVDQKRWVGYAVLAGDNNLLIVDLRRYKIVQYIAMAGPGIKTPGTIVIDPNGPKVYVRSGGKIAVVVPET